MWVLGACFIAFLLVGVMLYYPTIQQTTGEPVPNNHSDDMKDVSYQEGLWSNDTSVPSAKTDQDTVTRRSVGDYTTQTITYSKANLRRINAYADRHTRSYRSCKLVYTVFPKGFKQDETDYDMTKNGASQRSDVPVRATLYENNRHLDTDHDGYVCEKPVRSTSA